MAPCADRRAGNGRAQVKQNIPDLAFEERNIEPGDGKEGEGARGRTPGAAAEKWLGEARRRQKMIWCCNVLSINSIPNTGPASGHLLNIPNFH